ncbi:MAG: DUF1697 domain-containing protein, partial [Verrucomicrobiota bacterium]|nr:DUF1697 domain-containing protein [Verrucomicrobiota bacterium]
SAPKWWGENKEWRHNLLALLRGINVGGKSMLRMSDLKLCLEKAGFTDVRTYIQSGNVLFTSRKTATTGLARKMGEAIEKHFGMEIRVVVFTGTEWQKIVESAPKWWGENKEWRHNLLALLPGTPPAEASQAIATGTPEIDLLAEGSRVIYQSISAASLSSAKLLKLPIYRRVTVRNFNTAKKLAELLNGAE